MNVDIFIVARSNSQRLPQKHLQKINGKTIIENLVNKLKISKKIRKIIVCTTNLSSDDEFVKILDEKNIEYFRGDDKDVLKRLLDAAKYFKTDIIIDVSGDKIYTDTKYLDKVVDTLKNKNIDFVRGSNSELEFDPSDLFVHGFIPGGFKTNVLEKICKEKTIANTENGYTELFTLNDSINKKFIIPKINNEFTDKIKLDLDYPEDLELAREIFNELGNDFHIEDILEFFSKKPNLIRDSNIVLEKWKKNYAEKTSKFREEQHS